MKLNRTFMWMLTAALCLAALLALPLTASAVAGTPATDVIIDGVSLKDNGYVYPSAMDVRARFNKDEATLTLYGLEVVSDKQYAMQINGDIKIILDDERLETSNTISAANYTGSLTSCGIYCQGNMTLEDATLLKQCSLTVTGGRPDASSYGHSIGLSLEYFSDGWYCGKLTVTSGTLNCIGGSTTASMPGNVYGIYASQIVMDGGRVAAQANSANSKFDSFCAGVCLTDDSSITINGGSLTAISDVDYGILAPPFSSTGIKITAENASLQAKGKRSGINGAQNNLTIDVQKGSFEASGDVYGIYYGNALSVTIGTGIQKYLTSGMFYGTPSSATFTLRGNTLPWYKYKMNAVNNGVPSSYSKNTFSFGENKYLEIVPNDRLESVTLHADRYAVDETITTTLQPADAVGRVTYQWYRTSKAGVDEIITGAAGASYTPTSADVGYTLRVSVFGGMEYANFIKSQNSGVIAIATSAVILDANGGTAGSPVSVIANRNAAMPSILGGAGQALPTRDGYIFAGYFDAADGGTKYYNADGSSAKSWDKTANSAILYAHWTAAEYTVTLSGNGGTGGNPASVTAAYGAPMPNIISGSGYHLPDKEGYTFIGYYDQAVGGKQYYHADGTSAANWDKQADATLYAHWTLDSYTIILSGNSGTDGNPASVTAVYNAPMPDIISGSGYYLPERAGYTFLGYYDTLNDIRYYNADGSSARNWDKARNYTLNAAWKEVEYTVTLDPNDGSTNGYSTVPAYLGRVLPKTFVPKRNGYTFNGYYDQAVGGKQYYLADGAGAAAWDKSADTTLYAHWTPGSYTITLYADPVNGGTLAGAGTYSTGERAVSATANANYTFYRWLENGSWVSGFGTYYFDLTADRTLTAQFNYTPSGTMNGIRGISADQIFTRGQTVTFTAVGAGMDNENPLIGDTRYQPASWQTNPSGDFSAGYTQRFSTADMTLGAHTLTVTFAEQQYDGVVWFDTGITDTKSVPFTLVAALTITAEPTDQTTFVGEKATFSLTAAGDGLTYQWFVNRQDGRSWQKLEGSTASKHVTTQTTLTNDGYRYYCHIEDKYGNTADSKAVTLHVKEAPVTGDSYAPGVWLALLLLCGVGLVITAGKRRA